MSAAPVPTRPHHSGLDPLRPRSQRRAGGGSRARSPASRMLIFETPARRFSKRIGVSPIRQPTRLAPEEDLLLERVAPRPDPVEVDLGQLADAVAAERAAVVLAGRGRAAAGRTS